MKERRRAGRRVLLRRGTLLSFGREFGGLGGGFGDRGGSGATGGAHGAGTEEGSIDFLFCL